MRQQQEAAACRNYHFSALNVPPGRIPQQSDCFTLTARPRTDLWRPIASDVPAYATSIINVPAQGRQVQQQRQLDTLTAPMLFTNMRFPFVSAEVTVTAPWSLEWDQAGLVIFVGDPLSSSVLQGVQPAQVSSIAPAVADIIIEPPGESRASAQQSAPIAVASSDNPPAYPADDTFLFFDNNDNGSSTNHPTPIRWAKVGLELLRDTMHASSAVASAPRHGTDWSATLVPGAAHMLSEQLRVKMERVGQALWLSYEVPALASASASVSAGLRARQHLAHGQGLTESLSQRRQQSRWCKFREVTGFFCGVEDKAVRVGVYASRPAGLHASNSMSVDRDLVVEFEDLLIF